MAEPKTPPPIVMALMSELIQLRATLAMVAHATGIPAHEIPGAPAPSKGACLEAARAEGRGWNTLGKRVAVQIKSDRQRLAQFDAQSKALLAAKSDALLKSMNLDNMPPLADEA